ncbi:MAG: hypothetical protein LBJ72_12830 [Dysgonamonadaceae bacterium]|jgi:hypothetical protein|nr:hypothetical protein [Dysgonamonadaceae bacterium]
MNIDGIIITSKAKETLRRLQAESNDVLNSCVKDLTKLARKITIDGSMSSDPPREILSDASFLYSIVEIFESLYANENND